MTHAAAGIAFEGAARVLAARYGLDAQALGIRAVERAVAGRLAATGLDERAWVARLDDDVAERRHLTELVLVPETMLFRDGSPFDALAALAAAATRTAGPDRPFRVLSAACSTGEEPFSVAIALLAHGLPAAAVRITAIDASDRAIGVARTGRCGRSALRGAIPTWAEGYLERAADGSVAIDPVARSVIEFRVGNLLDPLPGGPFDAILCRNVLVYLGVDARRVVLRRIAAQLVAGAPLFVGNAEVAALLDEGWQRDRRHGPFALVAAPTAGVAADATPDRRAGAGPAAPSTRVRTAATERPPAPRPAPAAAVPAPSPARPAVSPAPAGRTAAAAPPGSPDPDDAVAAATALADAGDRDGAVALLERAIAADPELVGAHALLGVLHATAGAHEPARTALRRALYLDPGHAESRAQLGLLPDRSAADRSAAPRPSGDRPSGGRPERVA